MYSFLSRCLTDWLNQQSFRPELMRNISTPTWRVTTSVWGWRTHWKPATRFRLFYTSWYLCIVLEAIAFWLIQCCISDRPGAWEAENRDSIRHLKQVQPLHDCIRTDRHSREHCLWIHEYEYESKWPRTGFSTVQYFQKTFNLLLPYSNTTLWFIVMYLYYTL